MSNATTTQSTADLFASFLSRPLAVSDAGSIRSSVGAKLAAKGITLLDLTVRSYGGSTWIVARTTFGDWGNHEDEIRAAVRFHLDALFIEQPQFIAIESDGMFS